MKTFLRHAFLACGLLIFSMAPAQLSIAQWNRLHNPQTAPPVPKTPAKPFVMSLTNPSFVENKGQYNSYSGKNNGEGIQYGAKVGNEILLFTTSGVEFVRAIPVNDEKEHEKKKSKYEERRFETERFSLDFIGANPDATFEVADQSPEYFTFNDPQNINRTIEANGWKSLVCKNVWPGIDVKYEFPKDGGMKYSFIVHPGADASLIKEKWDGVKDLSKNTNGQVQFLSRDEQFTDAAPNAYYEHVADSYVASSFVLKKNEVSFQLENFDHSKTLIIDPWTSSPGFTGWNNGYDIAQDGGGNIYVYGGQNPYELKKFTSAGAPIWTYATSAFGYYGDMCLDFLGNPYVVYGPWGDACVKLTPAGTLTWSVTSGVSNAREIYRVFLNPMSNQLSIMGMEMPSTGGQCPMVLSVDPNSGAYSPSSLHPTCTTSETRGMCVDVNGDVYGLSYYAVSSSNPANDNIIWKVNSANVFLTSIVDGYNLGEVDASYTDSEFSGFNGMAVGCALYSYDGATLKKWDKNTMALLGSVSIPGGNPYNIGGVYTDQCGNVYVGGGSAIYMYDASLALVTSVATPGPVYDVYPGMTAGEILGTGSGFFGSFSFPTNTCNAIVTTQSVPSNGCPCNGMASVQATMGACSGSGNFNYQWFPTGGTNDTAFNLCPGTYTVVFTDVVTGISDSAVVNVTGSSPSVTIATATTNPTCFGYTNGSATANVSGGTGPYGYLWQPGGQTTQTATGLGAGTYTIFVTDSATGCTNQQSVTLTAPLGMSFTLASTPTSCTGCNGTATVNASGGSPGYTYSWNSSPVQNTQTANSLCGGAYTVTVTDNSGCMQDTALSVGSNNPVTLTAVMDTVIDCFGNCNGVATAVAANGNGPYTYSWNTTPVQNTATATGLCAGTYVVSVTDANSCVQTYTLNVSQPTKLTIPVMAPITACAGICGNLNAAPTGGTPGYTLNWNPGNLNGNGNTVCPASTTTYTLVVTDNNGCTASDSLLFTVNALPVISFTADTLQGCDPLCVNFTNNTANTASATWVYGDNNFGSATQHCYNSGTYDVGLIVVGTNGCADTLTQLAYIDVWPVPTAGIVLPPILPLSEWEPQACFGNSSSGASQYVWNFNDPNDTTGSQIASPCHVYSDTGTYCIDLIAISQNGCRDTTTQCLDIIPEGATIYVPNTFTPNGDGKNEIFMPVGDGIVSEGYDFMVFDRWGMLIYETHSWGSGWDGTLKGNKCQEDTYVWKVLAKDDSGNTHQLIGHVNLIR